jgi:prepilin-type processing-associated H-X9-DG protein
MHWSYFLFSNGKVKDNSFQCPSFNKGGAPRTNPGPEPKNWEAGGQIDDGNNSQPNALVDRQAPRMAYTMNAAIVPRNKFTREMQDGQRLNVLVQENKLKRPGDTVLGTEFLRNWKAIGINSGGQFKSKSHRPINVFYHLGSSFNEYQAPANSPGFIYGTKGLPQKPEDYGILPLSAAESQENVLDYTQNVAQINAVGRHHPGGDSRFGGTANFFFIDTHVERMTPFESVHKRKWGDRYYSLTGANEVLNFVTAK